MKYLFFFILSSTLVSCHLALNPQSFQMPPQAQEVFQKRSAEIEESVKEYVDQGLSQSEVEDEVEDLIEDNLEDTLRDLINKHSTPPFSLLPSPIKDLFINQNINDLKTRMKSVAEKLIAERDGLKET